MNFTSMGSCAGRPEINASSACPCDSPAVQNFSIGADTPTYICFWLDKNKQFICLCALRPASRFSKGFARTSWNGTSSNSSAKRSQGCLGRGPTTARIAHRVSPGSSTHGFFSAEVNGHQNLYSNPSAAMTKVVDAHHLSHKLAVDRAKGVRVWIRDEQAHPLPVELVFGREIHAVARRVQSRQDLVEVVEIGVRWPDAHNLWELQAPFASALRTRMAGHSCQRA